MDLANKYMMQASGEAKYRPDNFSDEYAMWLMDELKAMEMFKNGILALIGDRDELKSLNKFMKLVSSSVSVHSETKVNVRSAFECLSSQASLKSIFDGMSSEEVVNFALYLMDIDARLKGKYAQENDTSMTWWGMFKFLIFR